MEGITLSPYERDMVTSEMTGARAARDSGGESRGYSSLKAAGDADAAAICRAIWSEAVQRKNLNHQLRRKLHGIICGHRFGWTGATLQCSLDDRLSSVLWNSNEWQIRLKDGVHQTGCSSNWGNVLRV